VPEPTNLPALALQAQSLGQGTSTPIHYSEEDALQAVSETSSDNPLALESAQPPLSKRAARAAGRMAPRLAKLKAADMELDGTAVTKAVRLPSGERIYLRGTVHLNSGGEFEAIYTDGSGELLTARLVRGRAQQATRSAAVAVS
jgi:hypothetical protein